MVARVLRAVRGTVNQTRWYGQLYDWCMHDNWLVGKYVELTGNRATLDGCVFRLDDPSIPTRLKSRFALDQYEGAERYLVKRHLTPSLPVIELGGGVGVVSCTISRRLDEPRRHLVVEANPALAQALAANRDRNRLRFQILNRAYAYGRRSVPLDVGGDFVTASIGKASPRAVEVPAVSLEQLIAATGFDACMLVCDIEGAELDLFEHEMPCIARHVARLIVEVHGPLDTDPMVARALGRLRAAGFVRLEQCSRVLAFRNTRYDQRGSASWWQGPDSSHGSAGGRNGR